MKFLLSILVLLGLSKVYAGTSQVFVDSVCEAKEGDTAGGGCDTSSECSGCTHC